MEVRFAPTDGRERNITPADLQAALAGDPDNPALHYALGHAYLLQRELDEAERAFRRAADLDPDDPESRGQLAVILLARGRAGEAVTMLQELVGRHPRAPVLLANLAAARTAQGDWLGAEEAYRRALAASPDWAEMHRDLASLYHRQGRFTEAVEERRRVVSMQPDSAEAAYQYGAALQVADDPEGALAAYLRAAELQPDWSLPLHAAAGIAMHLGDWKQARAFLERSVAVNPESPSLHMNLGMVAMMEGDYVEGLHHYEWRWPAQGAPIHRPELHVPLWDGSPLAGRSLLLWCEQGFGDILQFARFASRIPKDGGRIVLHAPERLAPLLRRCAGVDQVVVDGEWLDADVQFPLLSLPLLQRATLDSLAGGVPYLHPPADCAAAEKALPAGEGMLRVGCVWASGTRFLNHHARDTDVASMAGLAGVPGVRLYSLQYGEFASDVEMLPDGVMVDLSDQIGDFSTTAAFASRLDLIITVDTAMAHLAGGLGLPVWLLVSQDPDWRWMQERPDSPWYPTMRLYRQARAGDWSDVFARVSGDLDRLAAERAARAAPPARPAAVRIPEQVFIKQYGERRTGTNLLRSLLKANYQAEVLMHILGDKHSRPADFGDLARAASQEPNPARAFVYRATFSRPAATTSASDLRQLKEAARVAEAVARAVERRELRFVVSIKDPYAWAVSMGWFLRWTESRMALPEERAGELAALCLQFNEHYAAWLDLLASGGPGFLVRYEELLAAPESVCARLGEALALSRRTRHWRRQDEVVAPAGWDHEAARILAEPFDADGYRHRTDRYLPSACRDVVTANVDWNLLRPLGYTPLG